MNVLFVVTSWPSADLLYTIRKIHSRENNQIHIVVDKETSHPDLFEELAINPDVPGHGWLPFGVVELDAVSYIAKKSIQAVVVDPHASRLQGLENVFRSAARARRIPIYFLQDLLQTKSCDGVADLVCTNSAF